MHPKTPILILLASLFLFSGAYAAAEGEVLIFEEIDSDHNGAISPYEARIRADLANNFDEIDSNGNGSLSVDEYTSYHNKGRMVPQEVEIPEPGAAPIR